MWVSGCDDGGDGGDGGDVSGALRQLYEVKPRSRLPVWHVNLLNHFALATSVTRACNMS